MVDLLPSRVRECGSQPHAHRLFDIVNEERETRTAESLRVRPIKGASNETLTVLRFSKPIGVLHAICNRIASFHACWDSSKRSDPLEDSSKDYVRIEFST